MASVFENHSNAVSKQNIWTVIIEIAKFKSNCTIITIQLRTSLWKGKPSQRLSTVNLASIFHPTEDLWKTQSQVWILESL